MVQQIHFFTTSIGRFGFRFAPEVVYAMIPCKVVGTYLLIKNGVPLYIGRSDRCLRRRLSSHPLLGNASHFVWEVCCSPFQAFCLESFWFHRLQNQPQLLNIIHPARPVGLERLCPFCNSKDIQALGIALGKPL